jgi:pimeloyl-ACP methyl ester carboxylesterase
MTEGVIFVPGIMGSVLQDGNRVVWPGTATDYVLGYPHMEGLRKLNLQATDIIRSVSYSTQYADLIDGLAKCGFHEGPGGRLRLLPYDWRKDNLIAAHALADSVDEFSTSLGADASIILLAHSMGGLISRCYLESRQFTARSGFGKVSMLITMGTPHRGAPMALAAALGQEKKLWLSKAQVKEIANNPSFPSLYQLLPPRSEPFAWNREHAARLAPYDIYDEEVARQLKLSICNLTAAQQFHALLDIQKRPNHVRYFFFAGTRFGTISSAQIVTRDDGVRAEFIGQDDAGDGTVPFWSSTQSGVQTEPVGGSHGTIYQNGRLKTLLGVLLGKTGILASTGDQPEVTVEPQFVELRTRFQVTVDFPVGTTKYVGAVRLRRVEREDGPVASGTELTNTVPLEYNGPTIDHLTVVLDAPAYAGLWVVELIENGAVGATTTLFVQDDSAAG